MMLVIAYDVDTTSSAGKRKGKIELEYYGQEDLQRLYEALTKTLGKEQP